MSDVEVPAAADADAAPSSARSRRLLDLLVACLCLAAVGLALTAGAVALAASDTSVEGTVEGGGWGGGGCYPTVSYAVDGRDYVLHAEKDTRWCALHWLGPAQVYYEPGDPGQARLSHYGDLPGDLLAASLGVVVVAAFLSTLRRPRPEPLPTGSTGPGRGGALRGRHGRVPRVLVALLIVGWLVAAAAVVVTGERRASLEDLQDAIDSGEVTQVGERGALLAGQRGTSVVHLAWREGGLRYFATVTQYRGPAAERRAPRHAADAPDVVIGDLDAQLGQGGTDLQIRPDLRTTAPSFVTYVPWGWHVFGWPLYLSLALLVMTVRVLIVAERPRWASRWAWFWLIVAAPVPFALAYLAGGGPAARARPTGRTSPWLGGTLAFLIAAALTAMQQPVS
ncbi:hypothetical protein GHK92_10360 [Nocardioides sp. dk4132]|uniref:hypothetical protein n=1 Tax=unclassified Nocardioides TaxID=2615069 RepID=UPI0012969D07|nr:MULTISPECIES: hypothetical protein [unclassified Nocardioides]MQW76279.1 hypothetical protein [Nocardioides sp. dk4132]QGA07436.1 hypothetical protein GFH29_08565 [Nocardioides sp. dk884]